MLLDEMLETDDMAIPQEKGDDKCYGRKQCKMHAGFLQDGIDAIFRSLDKTDRQILPVLLAALGLGGS
jgi:hypothetical protein